MCLNSFRNSLETFALEPTSFFVRLEIIRNQILFFWQNPSVLKAELLANRQLLFEVVIAIIVFIALLFALFKPSKKMPRIQPKIEKPISLDQAQANPTSQVSPKTFSKALSEQHEREPIFPTHPTRSVLKKAEPPPIQDLTAEEERALQEAMSFAGKQALAEHTGKPLQTEIFENSQAADAAKKIFAGQINKNANESGEAESLPEKKPGAFDFIVLYFMPPRSQPFVGDALFSTLREQGLRLNDQHIFEYADEDGVQFYVSSIVKPGRFDIHRLNYAIPGLSYVLDLSALSEPEAAFHKMLSSLHDLSQRMKGDILDEYRQRFTQASIYQYLGRVRAFGKK